MDTRNLAYLGVGILVAIIGLTIVGVAPEIWIPLALVAIVAGAVLLLRMAQADGTDIASRILAQGTSVAPVPADVEAPASSSRTSVDVELVRPADDARGVPAVWLHRRGGRRVHRFATEGGWTVQQVSTKDPDDPRKRVIGDVLTFATEHDAVAAADELAQGVRPSRARSARPALALEANA